MPLIRRMPKRGFNNANHTIRYMPVNLDALNRFENGSVVDAEAIQKAGLASGPVKRIKILGNGELKNKLTVRAHAFSATAKTKIEGAGGTCEVIATAAATKDK